MICGGIYERYISISAALFFVKRLTQGFAGSFLLSTCSSVEFGVVTLASAGKTLIIVSLDLGYLGFFYCRPMISPFSLVALGLRGVVLRWSFCADWDPSVAISPELGIFTVIACGGVTISISRFVRTSYWASTGYNGGLPWSSSSFPLAMAIRPQCTLVIVCWEHSKREF